MSYLLIFKFTSSLSFSVSIRVCICFRYLTTVDDLLTSIKKTEDSLLRLKRQRKGGNASTGVQSSDMTDENKIRMQIHLDVEEYGNQVCSTTVVDLFTFNAILVEKYLNVSGLGDM